MAKLGYHIAAGMMQGLGAGIIENAKQKREAALRAMDIEARRVEGAADRTQRADLSAQELASREKISTTELGMRSKELEAGRDERKLAREETAQYRKDQLRIDEDYKKGMVANSAARVENTRDPNKLTTAQIVNLIQEESKASAQYPGMPPTKTPAQIAQERFSDNPEVLKFFGVQAAPPAGPGGMTPGSTPGAAAQPPPRASAPDAKKMLAADSIKADYKAGKFGPMGSPAALEEAQRRLRALDAE